MPISVWIGLRPRWAEAVQPIAQFLAAFPVNLLFGAAVSLILAFNLNPNIWLSFLIIFGTQWYIVFNTIGGAAAFPNDLRGGGDEFPHPRLALVDAGDPARRRALLSDRRDHRLGRLVERLDRRRIRQVEGPHASSPQGVGSYIAKATDKGDFPKIVLGVAMMSIFVTLFNRLFWRQLYAYAERRLRL